MGAASFVADRCGVPALSTVPAASSEPGRRAVKQLRDRGFPAWPATVSDRSRPHRYGSEVSRSYSATPFSWSRSASATEVPSIAAIRS